MQTFFYSPVAFACAMLIQTSLAYAGDEEDLAAIYGDKAFVSIATGSQQTLRRAPAVATVITAEDIAMMGATDLDQVLETAPGLHISKNGLAYESIIVVRGIFSGTNPQILVLQNGVPLTTMFTGSRGLSLPQYPTQNIARIEIIRGPGSALYGSDAYSGVINIITKGPTDIQGTQFGGNVGQFKTRDAWIQHGGKIGPIAVSGFLRVGSTDGQKEIISADAQTGRDRTFKTQASLAPGPVNTGYDAIDANLDLTLDQWRLRAGYTERSDVGTGAGIANSLDPVGKLKGQRFTSDLSYINNQLAKNWGIGLLGSVLINKQIVTTDLVLSPPGTRFPTGLFPIGMIGHPDYSERDLRVSAYATYTGFEGHNVRFGVGHDDLNIYETKTIKNHLPNLAGVPIPQPTVMDYSLISPFLTPQDRINNYAYVQDIYQLKRDISITAGVRHDRFSDVGSTTNPRVALVWDVSLNVTAKFLYGQAFRAPSFNELYGINNPVQKGNPALRPETIKTFEAALSWESALKELQINMNVFRFSSERIVRLVPNPQAGTGSTFNNTGAQVGRGLELETIYDPSRTLRISGNYAYQKTRDITRGGDAGNAPHNHLYAKAEWRFADGWMVTPQFNWVSDRKREFGDTRPPVPDYKSLDLTLRTTKIRNIDISASVRNVFDVDIREPSSAAIPNDLPQARRAFYLQALYKF